MIACLEGRFRVRDAGSTLRIEVIGGATTFMTMAYILFVNGAILSRAGLAPPQVLTVTALVAGAMRRVRSDLLTRSRWPPAEPGDRRGTPAGAIRASPDFGLVGQVSLSFSAKLTGRVVRRLRRSGDRSPATRG